MIETAISALLILGGLFGLIGSFGLLKLRDPMQRLHAPTKATTLGVGATLVAATVQLTGQTAPPSSAHLLILGFLFLTAPLTALYLARAHLHRTVLRNALPPPAGTGDWASTPKPPAS